MLSSMGGAIQQQTPGMLNLAPAQARALHPGYQQHPQLDSEKHQQQRNVLNMKLNQNPAAQAAWNSPNVGSGQTGAQPNGALHSQTQSSISHTAPTPNSMNPPNVSRAFPQQHQPGSQAQPNSLGASTPGYPSTNGISQQQDQLHTPNTAVNPAINQLSSLNDPAHNQAAISHPITQHPQTPAQQVLVSAADRWGLLGLLAMIQNASLDVDQGLTSMGTDLGTMGLDMSYSGNLYSTFITPFSDPAAAQAVEPDYHVPSCYIVQTPPAGPAKASMFSEETLLFMFYAAPRDALQEVAAQELFNRNWRYHKEHRVWLTKDTTTATAKIPGGEQGSYIVWDPETWTRERKELTVVYTELEDRSPSSYMHAPGMGSQDVQQQQHQQPSAPSPSVGGPRGSFAM
ncbi:hypothetical protein BDV98DRAFT_567476 [Pterulicium gracile]|uniref:NOT2/NOT3/NOT5 C-terminal domain-containing protein n=1 Tax=Pterulicium gracile TaxID=1884261 RepID=A0A5C3QI85_9AGAR|nr:hypothetical protein BDV98DRAFT_567476 [Pterula gracilis]